MLTCNEIHQPVRKERQKPLSIDELEALVPECPKQW